MIARTSGPRISITGLGCHVPERVLTNEDLAAMVDTNDEWIRDHTGIRERRIAAADDKRTLGEPGREHAVRLRDRVDESGAARREVVGGGSGHPELIRQNRSGRRERHVGRHGRDDQQVDRGGVGAGHLEGTPARG